MPKCDVVLVCLKSVNNGMLQSLLPPLLHSKTLVVLIQNGIGVEEDVQKMFPDVQLAAGLAFICSAKTEPGVVNHQCYGSINLANYSCKDEALMQAVVDEFRQAGIETGLVEYHEARWKKAVWNMPFNGMTVALHTQTDQLLKNESTRQLIREHYLYTRPLEIAREAGCPMPKLEMLEAELRFLEADNRKPELSQR